MITHRVPKSALIIGGLLIASTMVLANVGRADWREVPTDKQQINMHVPGMEHWNPGYWKKDDEDGTYNRGTGYYTQWRKIEEYGIHAYLTYQKRVKQFHYYTVRDQVRWQLEEDFANFDGDINTYDSRLGEFEYIYFTAKIGWITRKCVGFQKLFAGRHKIIYGHYCPSRDNPVDDDMVGPLIDSINLNYRTGASVVPSAKSEAEVSSEPEVMARSADEISLRKTISVQDVYDTAKTHCETFGKTSYLLSNAVGDGVYTFRCE